MSRSCWPTGPKADKMTTAMNAGEHPHTESAPVPAHGAPDFEPLRADAHDDSHDRGPLTPTTAVQYVKGVGPARAKTFAQLGAVSYTHLTLPTIYSV